MVRAFDLFCGGGGSSYGAARAGAEVIGGVDLWTIAGRTFEDNHPGAKAITTPIEEVDAASVRRDFGHIDLLMASPECTNHTCARGARPKDEASRKTALHVLRFAAVLRPRWLVIENVVHMRSWARHVELVRALERMGYDVAEHVLDAADYGVPQRRKRLFLLCDRESDAPRVLKKRAGRKPAARSIIDKAGRWETGLLDNGRRANATLARANRGIEAVGEETAFLLVYYGSDGSGGWQSLDVPLRTITTLDRFGLVEPGPQGHTLRMLQVPELSRAMGYGTDLKLRYGTRRDHIRLLGNGVCPPVMQTIVSTLCKEELSQSSENPPARGMQAAA